jgi:hypothetical protein
MNPLLQDPAQLAQPIPGTATFGFDLIFNREHEVNAGYNDPDAEWLKLPNGRQALVAEVGVLADLMVLDTITGQGLSKDIIDAVTMRSRNQQANQQADYIKLKEDARKSKDFDEIEFDRQYKPIDEFTGDDMSKIFNANLGNSAFLNPLPFRAMFSALFMVEGIATSITVEFQKFSRTMVPTICKVNINMYALYIGVAKRDTFLYDNLRQSAADFVEQQTKDETTERLLEYGLTKMAFEKIIFVQNVNEFERKPKTKITIRAVIAQAFEAQIANKQIRDVKMRVKLNYFFSGSSSPVSNTELSSSVILMLKDKSEIPIDKFTGRTRRDPLDPGVNVAKTVEVESTELDEIMKTTLINTSNNFIHYSFDVELIGIGGSGQPVTVLVVQTGASNGGVQFGGTGAIGLGPRIDWTNPKQYGRRQ